LRPLRGDRLTLLFVTEVEDDWQAIIVQFVYTCWDRIVLSGYIERLQRPENVTGARIAHDQNVAIAQGEIERIAGVGCAEPQVVTASAPYRKHAALDEVTDVACHGARPAACDNFVSGCLQTGTAPGNSGTDFARLEQ
jgi:hypothetical protein